ncbi:MAG: hypothetical protein KBF73_03600 [Flavobacteriales bacterium]|nr:hypothetical protein [Flavobacteriales bacterium]
MPTDPVTGFPSGYWLGDTKIKFEFNEVYFYNNTTWFNQTYPTGVDNLRSHHLQTNPDATNYINCYIVRNSYPNAGGATFTSSSEPRIISYGWDDPSIAGTWSGGYWYWEHHLPHEMAHLLGLYHTYGGTSCCPEQSSGVDLLTDVFFTPFQYENSCPPGGPTVSSTDFCTNNVLSGHDQENNFLSPLQAGRAHRVLRSGSTRHFAYGLSTIPHNISTNQTWDFVYKSYNDIVVKSGNTLTVTCTLEMVKGSKIIVEPNAKLIVDGGLITTARSPGDNNFGRWNGIYVSGNSTASQTVSPTLFGTVILKNGAIIEHADGAINNFGLDANGGTDWNTFGGIIQCTDAIFKNNWRSVQFMAYTNKNSAGNPINDKSFFKKCNFSIDNDMLNGSHLYAHISQWATRGIAVNGCNFSNTQTAADADRGTGILTLDTRMTVQDHCNSIIYPCAPAYQVHTTFTGLRYGMHVTGGGNGNAVTSVSGATFTGNVQNGIYAGSTDNLTVANNIFNVDGQSSPVGVYLETTPITYIHDNTFNGVSGSVFPTGIVAKNLGYTATPIYSNNFNSLLVGSNAQGGNKLKSAGLRFICNNYMNNGYAISVIGSTPVIGTQGIAQHQGSISNGAGNTFSGSLAYDYFASGVQSITYWYVGTPPSYYGTITTSLATAEDCTNPGAKSTLMADYSEAVSDLVQKQTELAAIEDAGDTEGAMMSVTLAGVGQELQLRNKLLQISPNVSEEVLKATVQKPAPLPNAMLRDVLVANPQAGKAAEVMEAVDMLPTPMDEHMLEQIEVASYSLSPKERKESEVAAYLGNKERLASEVVFELMQDSLKYNPKAAKTFLTAKDDLDADMELMKIHAAEGNTEGMDEATARIAARQLSESEATRMEGYSEYRTLEKGLLEQNKGWLQADSSAIEQLMSMSSDETVAGQYAQNILEFMGIAEFEKEVLFPVLQPEGKKESQMNRPTTQGFVTVQPVPAREYIIVKYDVSHLGEGAVFELLDVSSKPMLSHTLQNSMDETVIDLRGIKAGNYAYRVIHGGNMHYSGKVVVAD